MILGVIIKFSGVYVWFECWKLVGVRLVSIMLLSNWLNGKGESDICGLIFWDEKIVKSIS